LNLAAVIVENRDDRYKVALDNHERFLEGWRIIRCRDSKVTNGPTYNELMTSMEFWKALRSYSKVLIFQHDSALLKPIDQEFLKYDYVGSPWPRGHCDRSDRAGGNGGFSIRGVEAHIKTLEKIPYNPRLGNEDVYFVHHLLGRLAPFEVCNRFACEAIFQLGTTGFHQIDNYLPPDECYQIRNQYKVLT